MEHVLPPPGGALAIAHRAGNEVALLHRAAAAGVHLVELDLWRFRGRLEVRHLKTAGPVPVLWDRHPARIVSGRTPRLTLAELLPQVPPGVELMLDLKGLNPAVPREVAATLRAWLPGRPYTVCSQSWSLLRPFREVAEARVVHSVGNERMLRRVGAALRPGTGEGISIDNRLLTPERVDRLRELTDVLMTWTVNTPERLRTLVGWGVTGVISDELDVLRPLAAGTR